MHVLILGAGVTGVTSAWFLARHGHQVTVLDRQHGAGLETSFANGGQLLGRGSTPWANPSALPKIVRWLTQADSPLRLRLRADPAQWWWAAQFLVECMPWCTRRNVQRIGDVLRHSQSVMARLREELDLSFDELRHGILHLCLDEAGWKALNTNSTKAQAPHVRLLDAAECVAVEPALAASRVRFWGGVLTPGDGCGDAHRFTTELASRAAAVGVRFIFDASAERIETQGGRVNGVAARLDGEIEHLQADAVLVCLGSYSPRLLKPLGVRLNVYPARGYSVTIPLEDPSRAPSVSISDESMKIVFSRLGQRLRVAGTAEIDGFGTEVDDRRCEAMVRRAFALFPDLERTGGISTWAGLRPSTPGNVPVIGRTGIEGLFINTGHGTLGWSMACGSGQAIAALISGQRPAIDWVR
jgi:D-amino-acid dehydrogenase